MWTSFWSRAFHEMVVFFFNEIVAYFVSRIVLQDNATCEFETRTLTKEGAAHVQCPLVLDTFWTGEI